jgi:hypothetical protein
MREAVAKFWGRISEDGHEGEALLRGPGLI